MDYKLQTIILVSEAALGFISARFLIPYFRRIKTGKFDFYIGDRFKQDGSEPKLGGAVIALPLILGLCIGCTVRMPSGYGQEFKPFNVKVVFAGALLALMLMCLGLYQDYLKETKRGIGIKARYLIVMEYVLCFGFLLLKAMFGQEQTGVLLPFRLGYLELGWLYYPIASAFMTAGINFVKLHDCVGGDAEKSVEGLLPLDAFLYSLGILSAGSVIGMKNEGMLFAVCTAGAVSGFLFWNLSPSKIYTGESGGLLLGGLIVVMTELSSLQFVFLLMGLSFITDGISAVLQYIVFKTKKKLLMNGLTLSSHLKTGKRNDYKVIGLFALISLIGISAGIMFFVYSSKILL